MPMMRGMGRWLPVEGFVEIRDDGSQIRARGQRFLEGAESGRVVPTLAGVPRLAQRAGQTRFFPGPTLSQSVALLAKRLPGGVVEHAGLGLGERLLDLEHLRQQLGRSLR